MFCASLHDKSHVSTFFAIFRFYPAWNWARLPESYKTSAYLSTDTSALDTFFSDSPTEINNQLPDDPSPEEDITRAPVQDEIPQQQVCTCTCTILSFHAILRGMRGLVITFESRVID